MLIVEYDDVDGITMPDGLVKGYVDRIISGYKSATGHLNVKIGAETMFQQFRLAILNDEISSDEIKFVFKDDEIKVDKYGRPYDWPNGFADLCIRQISAILRKQSEKRKS